MASITRHIPVERAVVPELHRNASIAMPGSMRMSRGSVSTEVKTRGH